MWSNYCHWKNFSDCAWTIGNIVWWTQNTQKKSTSNICVHDIVFMLSAWTSNNHVHIYCSIYCRTILVWEKSMQQWGWIFISRYSHLYWSVLLHFVFSCTKFTVSYIINGRPIWVRKCWPGSVTGVACYRWSRVRGARDQGFESWGNPPFCRCQYQMKHLPNSG